VVWSFNTIQTIFSENLYVLVTNVFSESKLILWYLNMSSIDLATRFKIGMYLLIRKSVTNAFLRSTDVIQVLNELPTDKRHNWYHKLDCYAIHTPTTRKKQVFEIFFLSVLNDRPCFNLLTSKYMWYINGYFNSIISVNNFCKNRRLPHPYIYTKWLMSQNEIY